MNSGVVWLKGLQTPQEKISGTTSRSLMTDLKSAKLGDRGWVWSLGLLNNNRDRVVEREDEGIMRGNSVLNEPHPGSFSHDGSPFIRGTNSKSYAKALYMANAVTKPILKRFKMSNIPKYDGTLDSHEHLLF
ncbi:hypothetical protein FXO38_22658 [Capsicum annuum]|uniref:Uncharacterized protein n=1 Tax=Capsicum annuum TaxID=4072 RepID=A0A2G2YFU4_CAPAN|nr:hypothetical protein FXO37_28480 [Capsicum annuum]KAF3639446.1 hypothetical protein FXO38_22658 [Capsicum annuum]PHT68579.1 hypothetical protein T459_28066 [Capsicum annuum]